MSAELMTQYESRTGLLKDMARSLHDELATALKDLTHVDRISFRVKDSASFVAKAVDRRTQPPYDSPLIDIEDQIAGRVIVFFVSDIALVLEKLRGCFNAVEQKHMRPKADAEFGYESNHLICILPPHLKPVEWSGRDDLPGTFELQVRTIFMHAYAEPQHNIGYKSANDLPAHIKKELAWIAASAWGADQAFERVLRWEQQRTSADS